jgi:hypothetical protein
LSYKRIDEETLQAQVVLRELELSVQLVWCVNDELGGGNGWKIGSVGVWEAKAEEWGFPSITDAETKYKTFSRLSSLGTVGTVYTPDSTVYTPEEQEEEEDADDDYWNQYDKRDSTTTPIPKPDSGSSTLPGSNTDEKSYYAQYDTVQPAMDNHDPDEAHQNGDIESTLGPQSQQPDSEPNETNELWSEARLLQLGLEHPRPSSSSASSGTTIDNLEAMAAEVEMSRGIDSTRGIETHIGTTINSLYR